MTSFSGRDEGSHNQNEAELRRLRIIVVVVAFFIGLMIEPVFNLDLVTRAPRLIGFMVILFPLVMIGVVISTYLRRN